MPPKSFSLEAQLWAVLPFRGRLFKCLSGFTFTSIWFLIVLLFYLFFYDNTLTIENYAGISHPHGVHGNTSVVAIVLLRHVEKDECWLFTLILNFDSI